MTGIAPPSFKSDRQDIEMDLSFVILVEMLYAVATLVLISAGLAFEVSPMNSACQYAL